MLDSNIDNYIKTQIFDVGHKHDPNPNELYILEKYQLYSEYIYSDTVSLSLSEKFIESIIFEGFRSNITFIYLITGYGSTGIGGLIKLNTLNKLKNGFFSEFVYSYEEVNYTPFDLYKYKGLGVIKLIMKPIYSDGFLLYHVDGNGDSGVASLVDTNAEKINVLNAIYIEDKCIPVRYVNSRLFKNNNTIKEVNLSKNIHFVGEELFYEAKNLELVCFEEGSELLHISKGMFQKTEKLKNISIPRSVSLIGESAFEEAKELRNIKFLNGCNLLKISEKAFHKCINLGTIQIPKSVVKICDYAFSDAENLVEIVFDPECSLKQIGYGAFMNCYSLKTFILPKGIEELSGNLLSNAINLEKFTFESNSILSRINSKAFYNCKRLKKIEIPKSVLRIYNNAFAYDSSLYEVIFEEKSNITQIDYEAFYHCITLAKIVIPKSVEVIQYSAFENASKLKSVIFDIDTKLDTISTFMFKNCHSIKEIDIPRSVKRIEREAFSNATSLKHVTLGSGVQILEDGCFHRTNNLNNLYIPKNVKELSTLGFNVGKIYFEHTDIPKQWKESLASSTIYLNVKNNQILDENNDFIILNDDSLMITNHSKFVIGEHTNIPNKIDGRIVSKLADKLFQSTSVRFALIPSSIKEIGSRVFYNNSRLEQVEFEQPSTLELIGVGAFESCTKLIKIAIPSSVKVIEKNAFRFNTNLSEVLLDIDSSLEIIGESAFYFCKNLENIVIPKNVITIGTNAFANNENLKSITFLQEAKLEKIEDRAFEECNSINEITIPVSVKYIGKRAFRSCSAIISISFMANSSIHEIGDEAFSNTKISTIFIPSSIINMGSYIFDMNVFIESILTELSTAPASWNKNWAREELIFWDYSFEGFYYESMHYTFAKKKNRLVILSMRTDKHFDYIDLRIPKVINDVRVEIIGKRAFRNSRIRTLYVPSSVISIEDYAFENCKDLTNIEFEKESSIKIIGNSAFESCSKIERIVLPSSIENIGRNSFRNLSCLKELIFDDECNLGNISYGSFYGATNLTRLKIPKKVAKIDDYAFANAINLRELVFEESSTLMSLGRECFVNSFNLLNIDLPKHLEEIGSEAFMHSSIKALLIPRKVKVINYRTFAFCKNLSKLCFEDFSELERIDTGAFTSALKLKEVKIVGSVYSIGEEAFKDCTMLDEVYFEENSKVNFIKKNAFRNCSSSLRVHIPSSRKAIISLLRSTTYVGLSQINLIFFD